MYQIIWIWEYDVHLELRRFLNPHSTEYYLSMKLCVTRIRDNTKHVAYIVYFLLVADACAIIVLCLLFLLPEICC